MYSGQLVFAQVMDHLPMHTFRRAVSRYGGNRYVKSFPCHSQFLCMAFAQLTYRESLRDIEVCLRAQRQKLYHLGIRSPVSRNTLANANKQRDWRIYAEVAQALIRIARPMYASDDLGLDLDNTVFALDASTIDLCLSVFPWAPFQSTKAAVKLHTLLDLRGPIPTFLHVSDGKMADVHALDRIVPEPGAFYVMDRALPRLRAPVRPGGIRRVLRHPRKVQHAVPASVLSAGRQDDRSSLRSDHRAHGCGFRVPVSAAAPPREVLG